MKRLLRLILGIAFLALGVVGLFVPILQGVLFIIAGLVILAPESILIQRMIHRMERNHPAVFGKARRLKVRFLRFFGRATRD